MIDELELNEFSSTLLTGVTVGIGSQVLIFENGASILIQCPFRCVFKGHEQWGHGEDVSTSVIFFDFLNLKVEGALIGEDGVLTMKFGGDYFVIVPEADGLESYVVNTKFGISPVTI
ncbi:hypothetical protein [Pseudomonas sp. TE3610]